MLSGHAEPLQMLIQWYTVIHEGQTMPHNNTQQAALIETNTGEDPQNEALRPAHKRHPRLKSPGRHLLVKVLCCKVSSLPCTHVTPASLKQGAGTKKRMKTHAG
jgi:hypothetical protein